MKLSILWSRLAGYSVAFFRQLAAAGCDIQLSYIAPGGDLKFEPFDLSFCSETREIGAAFPADGGAAVDRFGPQVILMSGWKFPAYMRIAREFRKRGVPVIAAVDNPWHGNLRQHLGCLLAPWLLHPSISGLYVCGERQRQFGRKLGFRTVISGLYAADVHSFDGLPKLEQRPNRFLFVGRLVERKGIRILLDAYSTYRAEVSQPLPLLMAGSGPLDAMCRSVPGVEMSGFVHPDDLPAQFAKGQCLILPSWLEHWGVVLHEAAAAGLPLIATENCGATTAFLRDGANGYLVTADASALTKALLAFHKADADRRQRMSDQSLRLGQTWSPSLQAEHLLARFRGLTGRQP